ncbi:hypothetical protein L596_022010 [Steinernema carpocapsae]|uniref:Uncharacterized protein n=1 Tax=Steinernema carpocapsae TaxID=34508 RepID=A0A4U5MKT9_STECR|nr:hypothetical protein L596_022010 [Steinernema carpocapsae]
MSGQIQRLDNFGPICAARCFTRRPRFRPCFQTEIGVSVWNFTYSALLRDLSLYFVLFRSNFAHFSDDVVRSLPPTPERRRPPRADRRFAADPLRALGRPWNRNLVGCLPPPPDPRIPRRHPPVEPREGRRQGRGRVQEEEVAEMRYLMKVVNIPFEEGVTQFGVEDLYREE